MYRSVASSPLEWIILRWNLPHEVFPNNRQFLQDIRPHLRHLAEEEQCECARRYAEAAEDTAVSDRFREGETPEVGEMFCPVCAG
jgi:hypothetical protein